MDLISLFLQIGFILETKLRSQLQEKKMEIENIKTCAQYGANLEEKASKLTQGPWGKYSEGSNHYYP